MDTVVIPPDEFVRRVFPRPFEALGADVTLERMQWYWRVEHRNPNEPTRVHRAILVPYGKKNYPREDRGLWWYARYYDETLEDVGKVLVKNVHHLDIQPGTHAYVHGIIICEITA